MKKIINENDCTKINEFKDFSKEINEKELYHFERTSNQIFRSVVDLLDLPKNKLVENFLILKDIKNIDNLYQEIQNNIQKEKILKLAKNMAYV